MSFSVDANLLVYASNRDCPEFERASAFLRRCAEGSEVFCLAWVTIIAYLRIATHASVFRRPLEPDEAAANVEGLLARPHVRTIGEGERFWLSFRKLSAELRPRGNLIPDAHLAALLRQSGVRTFFTRDRDFLRFDFLDVVDPLESALRDRPSRARGVRQSTGAGRRVGRRG